MDSLVTTEWLANEMGASDLRIVDATRHLPDARRDAHAEYALGHIPGAVFMDLEELVDTQAPIENTRIMCAISKTTIALAAQW